MTRQNFFAVGNDGVARALEAAALHPVGIECQGGDAPPGEARRLGTLHVVAPGLRVHGLESLEVVDDVVTFRYPFGEDGTIEWLYRVPRHADAPKLRARFSDEELGLDD